MQIKKGDMLCCEQVLCQMDPVVFGPDAREFNPWRFVDNPDLKKKVRAQRDQRCCMGTVLYYYHQ